MITYIASATLTTGDYKVNYNDRIVATDGKNKLRIGFYTLQDKDIEKLRDQAYKYIDELFDTYIEGNKENK